MEFSWIKASLFMKTVQSVLQGVFMNKQLIGTPRDGTVVFFIGFQKHHEVPFFFITQSAQYFWLKERGGATELGKKEDSEIQILIKLNGDL